ncbi:transcription factor FapR [Caldalkalibacillus thermarum]|uniref:transcription factor FapR n=1 Tax=Caldalkalibacillus thermarum TaxID=296745 RepID=UPI00166B0649|nr:transcription factor FapR [Caldalkalibacillus thermarum]GGK14251.1 transcription factor FapR [Caldalkalibacillus thermarum]
MPKLTKKERQNQLVALLHKNPFMTDEELARHFQVSVQTIRLDRLEKSIPELRERIKSVAEQNYDEVRSLLMDEVIGEIIDLHLDKSAISILDIREEHVFTRNQIARGHHLFAQANSLAVAVIDDELALTASAKIRFHRPVKVGERVVAKAKVLETKGDRTKVQVESFCGEEMVFSGQFTVFRSNTNSAREVSLGT